MKRLFWGTFFLLTVTLGAVIGWQLAARFKFDQLYIEYEKNLNEFTFLVPEELGTLYTQGIDKYPSALASNIRQKQLQLLLQAQAEELTAIRAPIRRLMPTPPGPPYTDGQLAAIKAELSLLERDSRFLKYTTVDYLLFGLNPEFRKFTDMLQQWVATINYAQRANKSVSDVLLAAGQEFIIAGEQRSSSNEEDTEAVPKTSDLSQVYVKAGDVIGLMGCTGVCTGPHLHLETYRNGQLIDPCTVIPFRSLSRWGLHTTCGIENSELVWPLPNAWIISQGFDDFSDTVGHKHDALDVIDRVGGAVVAAHDGYLTKRYRPCAGALVCNDRAAQIVTICSQPDCSKSEWKTDYYHLEWMVGEKLIWK